MNIKDEQSTVEKCQRATSGLAQAGAEVFWLKGSAVVPPAFAKPRGVIGKRWTAQCIWEAKKTERC